MQTTTHYGLQKPDPTDAYNKATDNSNMDAIDAQMYQNAQAAAAAQSAANAAQQTANGATAAGASTDTVIGNRTVDPTQVPTGLTGTLTQFLSWISNRIKVITGTANWYDAPPTTLAAANAHMTSTNNPHNVTAAQVGAVSTNDPVYLNAARLDTAQTWTAAQTMPLAEGSTLAGRDSIPNYNQYMSSPDAKGIYTVVQLKRNDGTLYMQSTLSNADANGNYQTDTWQFYDSAGNTVIATHIWSITYDANNKISQKVMSS